jgi:hypothetical protein
MLLRGCVIMPNHVHCVIWLTAVAQWNCAPTGMGEPADVPGANGVMIVCRGAIDRARRPVR